MAVLLKDVIPLIVDSHKDWRILLLKEWHTIMGSLGTRVRLEKVTHDMIIVGVYEAHWMQELYLLTPLFITNVNNFLGKPYIKQVRFKLVEQRSPSSLFQQREKKQSPSHHITLDGAQKKALEKIFDPQLKDALIGFWGKCQALSYNKR